MGPANLGAVARSMSTFGLADLHLVAPQTEITEESYMWAVHGRPILEEARVHQQLEQAITDCNLVLGLTRRSGKHRHRFHLLSDFVEQRLDHYLPGRVALVFGNEGSGLSLEDLELCHRLVTIPTHPEHGSMNLAHAVTATLYEFFRQGETEESPSSRASADQKARMLDEVATFLDSCGYPHHRASLAEEMTKLGDLVGRVGLEEWEVRLLLGILKQVRYTVEKLRKEKKEPPRPGVED